MSSTAALSAVSRSVSLRERFRLVRERSLRLSEPLTPEDMMVQSCPEASPAKWHLAHTAWFFESFVAREFLPGYKLFDVDFPWLFNSYYQTFAEFPDKRLRASFSRPGLEAVICYREHVDAAIERLFEDAPEEALRRIELGLHHEEQHQELLLTDILHALYTNPLQPAYLAADSGEQTDSAGALPLHFLHYDGGVREIGAGSRVTGVTGATGIDGLDGIDGMNGLDEVDGSRSRDGFSFDNERPRHRVWLEPFEIANRLVTCGEYAEFIADGGYERPELWLSAGWQTVQSEGWRAPLYWRQRDGQWSVYGLRGTRTLAAAAGTPVSQVSLYEADAYARWAGKRLPTEAEWETVATTAPRAGNMLESGRLQPVAVDGREGRATQSWPLQLWGDCWEWTGSAYLGYPGFEPLGGALGEYNGKFMSGQMVLRGGSCVTPEGHIRASYRNFFPPETRWQFSGIRLAANFAGRIRE